ncbi:hypothetical protein GOP47_0003662 [Adiantum capillus-veneris]|uniref:Uncharacterized protein n=1 Tax=Adiantum capillus-veneris TaxID=13818 RepID=A0A9D4V6J4_ADICA|nr:hypothetical protein GOP47_0003662 [Adiantum capillus-veneris]
MRASVEEKKKTEEADDKHLSTSSSENCKLEDDERRWQVGKRRDRLAVNEFDAASSVVEAVDKPGEQRRCQRENVCRRLESSEANKAPMVVLKPLRRA